MIHISIYVDSRIEKPDRRTATIRAWRENGKPSEKLHGYFGFDDYQGEVIGKTVTYHFRYRGMGLPYITEKQIAILVWQYDIEPDVTIMFEIDTKTMRAIPCDKWQRVRVNTNREGGIEKKPVLPVR